MRGPGTTTGVEVRTDLDSGALLVCLHPDHTEEQVRATVDASVAQRPGAVVLDLGPEPDRWIALLRGLARTCARQGVPLLAVPVLAPPGAPRATAPVRSLVAPLPLRQHPSVGEALASLPSALVPSSHRFRTHLSAEPAAAAQARAVAAAALRSWGLDDLIFTVELITSELVSNAVLHAATPADLLLRLGPDVVRVAVRDCDPTAPLAPSSRVDITREGGRGLLLVQAAAHRWGVLTGSHDKIVWADVNVAPSPGGLSSGYGRSARGDR